MLTPLMNHSINALKNAKTLFSFYKITSIPQEKLPRLLQEIKAHLSSLNVLGRFAIRLSCLPYNFRILEYILEQMELMLKFLLSIQLPIYHI